MAITGIIISILMIIISFIGMILNILEKIRRITSWTWISFLKVIKGHN